MSRILKRPMFRLGGSSNEGVMTGLVNRKGYQEDGFVTSIGQRASELTPELEALLRQYTPKTSLPLGAVGANLLRGKGFRESLIDPYLDYTKKDDAREAAIKSGAAKLGIGQALKVPKDSRTSAVKNAMSLGLIPGTKEFNDYVTAATIKGGGLDIQFNADGTLKSISEGGSSTGKQKQKATSVKITTFQMNNAAQNLISNLHNAKTGPMGSTIMALDSTGAQLKQLANTFGFRTTGKDKTYDEQGDAVDKYIEKHFGSGIGGDAEKFAKIKSVSINLAYLMARIDEPGGRFTDRDIALKMEEMGLGADPERTIKVLINSLQIRNSNAAFEYKELTGGKILDWSDIDVVGEMPSLGEDTTGKKTIRGKVIDNDPAGIRNN